MRPPRSAYVLRLTMPTSLSSTTLDSILALQLSVAWAGERHGDPSGLGWWETSLADADGGGDFFQRMFPRTHVWAALGSMREAARRVDAKARGQSEGGDQFITLFHFGFALDEALDERFEHHKRRSVEPTTADDGDDSSAHRRDPPSVFGPHFAVRDRFERAAFEKYLEGLAVKPGCDIVPGGREITAPSHVFDQAALQLARALLPLTSAYPLPFYRAPKSR